MVELKQVKEVVDREIGRAPETVVEVEEGLMHETYEVRYNDRNYIVQFKGDQHISDDSLENNISCYKGIKQAPVPEVITEMPSRYQGEEFSIVEKLPGQPIDEVTSKNTRQAGEVLAKIHQSNEFEETGPLRFNEGLESEGFEEGELDDRILKDLEGKIRTWRERSDSIADAIDSFVRNNWEKTPDRYNPVLCHNDFSPNNVLYDENSITGVIDFDYAYSGHAERDMAKAANSFWLENPSADWDIRDEFYEGYQKIREIDSDFEEYRRVYEIETLTWLTASMMELREAVEDIESYETELERMLSTS